jgi:hypothetical protein
VRAGSDDEDDDEEDMEESSDDEEEEEVTEIEEGQVDADETYGIESVVPAISKAAPTDLRKGMETPVVESTNQKQLYTVLEERKTANGWGKTFRDPEVQYVVPGGAESVLAKVAEEPSKKKKQRTTDDDDEELDKNFKF